MFIVNYSTADWPLQEATDRISFFMKSKFKTVIIELCDGSVLLTIYMLFSKNFYLIVN